MPEHLAVLREKAPCDSKKDLLIKSTTLVNLGIELLQKLHRKEDPSFLQSYSDYSPHRANVPILNGYHGSRCFLSLGSVAQRCSFQLLSCVFQLSFPAD